MAKRNVPPAGHSDPSTESAARLREESLAAHRLVSLLGRIRNGARKTLDVIKSNAFYVLPVTPEDVNVAVSYLVKLGVCHEEAQQLRCEYERSFAEGGCLQLLMRNPPLALNYSASDDDPDDPEVARVKQVNAERLADHQREIDDQRGIAIDAVSALLNRVGDLVEAVESVSRGDDREAPADGMGWPEALDKAEERRLAGEGFTSYRKMAEAIGCTTSVLHDAIKIHGTLELKEWASKQRGASRKNAAPEAAAVAFENTPQGREPDPADMLHDCDADVVLAKLLDQASPDERARIHAMPLAEKRQLAETFYRDPDGEEQDRRHAEVKKKRSRAD